MASIMSGMSQLTSSARLPARPSRSSTTVLAVTQPAKAKKVVVKGNQLQNAAFLAATTALLSVTPPALAADESVDGAIENVVGAVKAAGEIVKAGISAIGTGVEIVKEGYEVVAPVVQRGVEAAAPVVSQAYKVTSEATSPALKAALPALQSTTTEVTKALQTSGVPLKAVGEATKAATDATTTISPYISKGVTFVTTTDPVLLGEYAIGAFALYLLAPPLLGAFLGSFRGFAGELSAVAALDALNNDSCLLVDIRTIKEKEAAGVPDVPSSASSKLVEVEYAVTEDRKLRGQLRDPSGIEAQVTALQIASLKRASTGTKIILLDRYGGQARTVAKELSRKGFGKVFVVSGGFDGNAGWVKSKLQIKPISSSSASTGVFGTVSTRTSRKSLPAPKSA